MVLNTPAGVVDLETGTLWPRDPALLLTQITSVGPGGECPRWDAFIREVTGEDADLAAYLARLMGYCLTGSTREQVFAFFLGNGANGKSVFLQTIAGILGDHAATAAPDTFLDSGGTRHLSELAGLRSARLVLVTETGAGQSWAEARIKSASGGEKLRVNFMRQDHFEFLPKFKLIVAGNHRPRLAGTGEAMRRRLHVVPFDVTIPSDRRDPLLASRLASEGPGILGWLICGCREWQRIGLCPPARIREASEAYVEDEDIIGEWIAAQCETSPPLRAPSSVLFSNWKRWADAAGHEAGSRRAFGEAPRHRGFVSDRTPRERLWCGLSLRVRPPSGDGIP